jgi:hypothetical protein
MSTSTSNEQKTMATANLIRNAITGLEKAIEEANTPKKRKPRTKKINKHKDVPTDQDTTVVNKTSNKKKQKTEAAVYNILYVDGREDEVPLTVSEKKNGIKLDTLQKIVGGGIETVKLRNNMMFIVHENSAVNGSEINTTAYMLSKKHVFGTVVYCDAKYII